MNYRTLITLCLSLTSLSAVAEQRWFEVELLMFERNVKIQDIKEHLSSQEIIVDTDESISLLNPIRRHVCVDGEPCFFNQNPTVITRTTFDSQGNNFERLDSSHLQLVEQRESLEKHNSFEPVFHMVWRMPVESGKTAKPIHLFAGENLAFNMYQRQTEKLKNITLGSSSAVSTEVQQAEITEPVQVVPLTDKWAIDGNFKIYLDHYLFVDSQLIIRKEVTEDVKQVEQQSVTVIDDENGVQIATENEQPIITQAQQQTLVKEILFNQNRRLRSEEIHYLDHPLMGIIIQIRKIPEEK